MAFTILNNTASALTLGELNKNITKVGKELAKISHGQRIVGAGDGAAEYAISEQMRVRIRALAQDKRNVENGSSLLKVAEGAIQNQLEIMRSIKEKVLDAANDSNTDADRAIIQKEINHNLAQIEEIAYRTTYNGKQLLVGGDVVGEKVIEDWYGTPVERTVIGQRVEWTVLDDTQDVEGSSIDIIPDDFPELDGVEGPFAVFTPYKSGGAVAIEPLGLSATRSANKLSGAGVGDPNHVDIDLSSYASVEDLDGAMFYLSGSGSSSTQYYILTTTPDARFNNAANNTVFGINYTDADTKNSNYHTIDISGCATIEDVAAALARSSYGNTYYSAAVNEKNNKIVTLTTRSTYLSDGASTNNSRTASPGSKSISTTRKVHQDAVPDTWSVNYSNTVMDTFSANNTGRISGSGKLDGGVMRKTKTAFEPDIEEAEGKAASITINVNGLDGQGITIKDGNSVIGYLTFRNDNKGTQTNLETITYGDIRDFNTRGEQSLQQVSTGTVSVGINYNQSFKMGDLTFTPKGGGVFEVTAPLVDNEEPRNNRYSLNDGINANYSYYPRVINQGTPIFDGTFDFKETKPITGIKNKKEATDPTPAFFKIDLTKYAGLSGGEAAEELISELNGKSFQLFYDNSPYTSYQFYDGDIETSDFSRRSYTGKVTDFTGITGKVLSTDYYGRALPASYTKMIDISSLRTASSLKDGLQAVLTDNIPTAELREDGTGVNIYATASYPGTRGNGLQLPTNSGDTLAHYDIDFKTYLDNNPQLKFPQDLYGKGFRVYCASDPNQWFNFTFTGNVTEGLDDKPEVEDAPDVKNIFVDISKVKDASELVSAIYKSAEPQLVDLNHYIHLAANSANGILTVYDDRPFDPTTDPRIPKYDPSDPNSIKYLQDKGAKIMDGVMDYLGKRFIDLYDREEYTPHRFQKILLKSQDIVIHDTDKASNNIHLHIPRMTLDQIFEFPAGTMTAEDFNVMTKENRDKLLGEPNFTVTSQQKGYIDTAIDNITDANTLIGAQLMRLEHTAANITAQEENTIASDSTIRDADMAKEMTSYTKNNILSQASQAMLVQANQNASSVLSLLA